MSKKMFEMKAKENRFLFDLNEIRAIADYGDRVEIFFKGIENKITISSLVADQYYEVLRARFYEENIDYEKIDSKCEELI